MADLFELLVPSKDGAAGTPIARLDGSAARLDLRNLPRRLQISENYAKGSELEQAMRNPTFVLTCPADRPVEVRHALVTWHGHSRDAAHLAVGAHLLSI